MKQSFGIAQAPTGNLQLIIVDEPTTGLGSTRRNRFHNLVAEISANPIVIQSIHINKNVANLCVDMAIIFLGAALATATHVSKRLNHKFVVEPFAYI